MDNVIVTKHAEKRMRERLGIQKKSTQRIADRAYLSGKNYDAVTSKIRRWAKEVCSKHDNNELSGYRFFGDKMFIFDENVLITVLQIPVSCK